MSALPPPPQVSPDGRFYWNGSSWIPFPTQEPSSVSGPTIATETSSETPVVNSESSAEPSQVASVGVSAQPRANAQFPADVPQALLSVQLHANCIRLRYSPLEVMAARNPQNEGLRRTVYVAARANAWSRRTAKSNSGPLPDRREPQSVPVGDPTAAVVLQRSFDDGFGRNGIDFSHVMPAEASDDVEKLRRAGWDLRIVPILMKDGSVLVYDLTLDLHSAWQTWGDAEAGLAAYRAENGKHAKRVEELGTDGCIAVLARGHVEGGRLLFSHLLQTTLPPERVETIAAGVDPQMKGETRARFLHISILPMADESILVWDPNLGELASAWDGDMCTMMFQATYAPHQLPRWMRKELRP